MKKLLRASLIVAVVISVLGIFPLEILAENVSEPNKFELEYNIGYFNTMDALFASKLPVERDEGSILGIAKILSYEDFYKHFSNQQQNFSFFDAREILAKYDKTVFEDKFLLVLLWKMGCPGTVFRVTSVDCKNGVNIELTASFTDAPVPQVVITEAVILEMPLSLLDKNVSVSSNYAPVRREPQIRPGKIRSFQPRVWVDSPGGLSAEKVGDLTLDEFPGTVFSCTSGKLTAIDADGEKILIPREFALGFWNIYLADLNGDGLPEFCATVSLCSGVRCYAIYVYDYAAGELYKLTNYDIEHEGPRACHILSMKDGQLVATQEYWLYPWLNPVKTGSLAIIDGELVIIEAEQGGVKVTGLVKSYNPKNVTNVQLLQDNQIIYETVIPADSAVTGQLDQVFAFKGVQEGVYDLVVSKETHLSYTITGLTVGTDDLDLSKDSDDRINMITLPYGDINGDGFINSSDLSLLILPANYNKHISYIGVDPMTDLTGSGWVNSSALSIIIMPAHYNKTHVTYPYGSAS